MRLLPRVPLVQSGAVARQMQVQAVQANRPINGGVHVNELIRLRVLREQSAATQLALDMANRDLRGTDPSRRGNRSDEGDPDRILRVVEACSSRIRYFFSHRYQCQCRIRT